MANTNYKSQTPAGIDLYRVDDSQLFPIFQKVVGIDISNGFGYGEFVYLKGLADTVEGSVVTFDEAGVTALIAANAKGPVAVAMAAIVADHYGWYQRLGKAYAKMAVNSADNAFVGYETTAGSVGDGRAAGDEIIGVIARSATDGATTNGWLQIYAYPSVNDATGS